MTCRFDGCKRSARWQAIIIMPPPLAADDAQQRPPIGFPSPLICCDKHKRRARPIQALGPNGMQLLEAAFKVAGKQPPNEGDLSLDWAAYDGGALQFGVPRPS